MTNSPTQPSSTPPAGNPLEAKLLAYRQPLSTGLFVAALLLAIFPIYLLVSDKTAVSIPKLAWGVAITLTTLGVAILNVLTPPSDDTTEGERLRFRVLLLGGLIGLWSALLGIVLPFTAYSEVFAGGLKEWRSNPSALAWCAVPLFGGLILMFLSLQLARGMERSSAGMRRLLYGYNAVLTTILLAIILGLVNVLSWSSLPGFSLLGRKIDWTERKLYTLHQAFKNQLADLRQPVKAYIILPSNHQVHRDMEELLQSCRSYSDQLTWESLSPDRNRTDVGKLLEQYPIADGRGILVVYGGEGSTNAEFIKENDIYSQTGGGMGAREPYKYTFKGQDALMKAITSLSEGKKAVVYFTQGNGELDFNDRGGARFDQGMGALVEQVGKGNYELKELKLDAVFKSVPEDADVVVVARPTNELPANAVQGLREYMRGDGGRKKGKMMALFDVVTLREGGMIKTGLEGLLGEYNVRVNDNRVLSLPDRSLAMFNVNPTPTTQMVVPNPRSSNPIARALTTQENQIIGFVFDDTRTVTALHPANPGAPGSPYTVDELLVTRARYVWAETDLSASPSTLVKELIQALNKDPKAIEKLSPKPLSVAVAVSESTGAATPPVPGHPPISGESVPRLLVFGDASWISNQSLDRGGYNFSLFTSCLSWLREKAAIGTVAPPTERTEYTLNMPEESVSRAVFLPLGLTLLGVLGLGGGVWVVRRR